MQKFSETVYSSLFWLISSLLVWLVILPVSLICLPVVILVKGAGQLLFKMPSPKAREAQVISYSITEGRRVNATEPLLGSLLLKILVAAPALLAAVISLQPTRFLKQEEHVVTERFQSQPVEVHKQSSPEAVEVPAEE